MAFAPIEQGITNYCFQHVGLIATDMDGTLTQQGKFTAGLLQAFEGLRAAESCPFGAIALRCRLRQIARYRIEQLPATCAITPSTARIVTYLTSPKNLLCRQIQFGKCWGFNGVIPSILADLVLAVYKLIDRNRWLFGIANKPPAA